MPCQPTFTRFSITPGSLIHAQYSIFTHIWEAEKILQKSQVPMRFRTKSRTGENIALARATKVGLPFVLWNRVASSGEIWIEWKTNCRVFCEFGLGAIAHFKASKVWRKSASIRIVLDRSFTERCIRGSHPPFGLPVLLGYICSLFWARYPAGVISAYRCSMQRAFRKQSQGWFRSFILKGKPRSWQRMMAESPLLERGCGFSWPTFNRIRVG